MCVCPLGELVCLTNSIERARCEEAGYLASHISYQSFLITFLAAVDHLTESCGAGRESGCRMLGCTNNELKEFVSCLGSLRELCQCRNCLFIVGAIRSGAGVILEVWLIIHVIFPFIIVLSGKMFL